ncbi:MAG: rhomboid family intramembrane serine protease [Halobacteriales archaeon]
MDVWPVTIPSWLPLFQLLVVGSLIVAATIVRYLDRKMAIGHRLRSRLLMGVPWGTVVSIVGVLCVYLFIQGGWDHWFRPVTVPFSAWSYFYPLGIALAPFSHVGAGHLIGNLVGTIVFAPIVEYAWGHYPTKRGAQTFTSWRTNPFIRAFVAFPVGVIIVGWLTSIFSWGPIIGFSGVVFAFAGFALVRYPIGTVIALSVREVLRTVYRALQNPVVVAEAKPTFSEPWWAGIAVQGHLFGLFLGIVAGALVFRTRDREELPGPARLWSGALIVGTALSLWAVWWYRGGVTYVLYRGVGMTLVALLALLVTLGIHGTTARPRLLFEQIPVRTAGLLVLLFPALVLGFGSIPLNLTTVADGSVPGDGGTISVEGYTVAYAEDVTNQKVRVINLSVFGETTQVTTSGVIVVNEQRNIWTRQISKSRLAFAGTRSVRVGGVGWRQAVIANRTGYSAANGGTAYRVQLKRFGTGKWTHAFASSPATAEPTLAGRNVTVEATSEGFFLNVTRSNTSLARVPVPTGNETVRAGGITFAREGRHIYASVNDTRIRIVSAEIYQGESS